MAAWNQASQWSSDLSSSLGLAVTGLKILRNYGRTHGFFGSRIMREQGVGSLDWLDGDIWAVGMSTNVAAIRYDSKQSHLYVAFTTRNFGATRVYRYYGVERHRAESFFLAPSLGAYVHKVLKPGYAVQGPMTTTQI